MARVSYGKHGSPLSAYPYSLVQRLTHAGQGIEPISAGPSTSYTNSQQSSLGDSVSSQTSLPRPPSPSHLQASQSNQSVDAVTPSTPVSTFSSQEQVLDGISRSDPTCSSMTDRQSPFHGLSVKTDSIGGDLKHFPSSAPKRTVNGTIKSPNGGSATNDPANLNSQNRSRNVSTSPRSNQMGQVGYYRGGSVQIKTDVLG